MGGGGTILWLVMLCGLQIIYRRVWAGARTKDRLQPAGVKMTKQSTQSKI